MPTCFVIQPFDDGGKFDKRCEDIFFPAIRNVGLEPYRVDKDPKTEVVIDSIEKEIRDAEICLADITTDNPNVWYELGYALASNKVVVMVCSDERATRFPFDIQHRAIVTYKSESASDFEQLQLQIQDRIKALLTKEERGRQLAKNDLVEPREGFRQYELAVLGALAEEIDPISENPLKNTVERTGFTAIAFNLGLKRLKDKQFIESVYIPDCDEFQPTGVQLTSTAWKWIEENDDLFLLKRSGEHLSSGTVISHASPASLLAHSHSHAKKIT